MIRAGLPFGFVMTILVVLWAISAVVIHRYAPQLKGQHLKIALRALGAAVAALAVVIIGINAIAVFFN